jgi:hypothetical protein
MQYIIKLSIALPVVYLFYWLLLRRLTFYNWNRWYLLGYSMFCFFIPLINVFDWLQQHGLQNAAVISYIPALPVMEKNNAIAATGKTGIDWWILYVAVITAGCLFMLGRLLVQFLSLRRLRSSAMLLSDGPVKLYHIDKKIIPFSTSSAIYVNRNLHNEQELQEIIRHEFIHVKQRHSFDLWWGEILCILNWYNPFAWLIRKAIRQNLEFIADHQVLQSGLDRKQYQYLLLKVTGIAPFRIASNFNFSSLKKRIVMMNKNKSANVHLMRFLFMLPLLVVVLLAFRKVAVNNYIASEKKITDTVPASAPKRSKVPNALKEKGIEQITKKIKENKVYIKFENGTTKVFDLNKPEEKEAFEEEYGELAPPPPPLAAPRPGHASIPAAPPVPETAPVAAPTAVPAIPGAPVVTPAAPASVPTPPTPVKASGRASVAEVREGAPVAVAAPDEDVAEAAWGTTAPKRIIATADVIEIRPAAMAGIANPVEETTELLEIKNTTTREQLEQLTHELKEKGYTLTLSHVKYNDGALVSLEGSVSNGTTKGNFSGDRFKTLTVRVGKSNTNHFYITVYGGSVSFQQ